MKNYNTVWVTGTPRTGSMWTMNVIREIFRVKGFKIYPEQILQEYPDWIRLFKEQALSNTDINARFVIKIHNVVRPDLPLSRYVTNIRNPYDVCASYYEFMGCDVKRAIQAALSLKTIISRYSSYSPESLRVVRYEDIESDPTGVIHDLAGFLECEISSGDAESISSRYSRENVKSLVSETDAALEHKIRNNEKVQANEIVRLTPSNYRALDLETGFQTGHVSNRKSGEWRSSFSQSEITRIIEVLDAAVTDLGYPSEMK